MNYVYGQDGQRAAKYTAQSETLYFNKMWTLHTDGGNSHLGGEYAKNVYLGETRIVTKLVSANEIRAWEEVNKIYFYHSDHLGSASLITDENGNEYQRLEYTPYGEVWVDKYSQIQESTALLPYKFTGKERDEETGLYYYGARYLDAKYSRWLSTDPALGDYIPQAPVSDEAKKHNQNLPGMGGLFNTVNFNLYHYAGNNPVKYTDPDGRETWYPLTYGKLWQHAFASGLANPAYPRAKNNSAVGYAFEKAVGEAFCRPRNLLNFPTGNRTLGVKPDFVGLSKSLYTEYIGRPSKLVVFPTGNFIEAKTSKLVDLDGSGNEQMKGMIDVLSETKSTNGSLKAKDAKAAFLFIATPYDTKIDSGLINYAKKKGVTVVQFLAEYSDTDVNKIRFSEYRCLTGDIKALNIQTSTGVIE